VPVMPFRSRYVGCPRFLCFPYRHRYFFADSPRYRDISHLVHQRYTTSRAPPISVVKTIKN
jgi:hypothetical protein